jgi:hypothetical protein
MTTGARFAKWGLGLFIFGVFLTRTDEGTMMGVRQ